MSFYDQFISQSLLDDHYKPASTNSSKLDVFEELNLLHKLMAEEDMFNVSDEKGIKAPCNSPNDNYALDSSLYSDDGIYDDSDYDSDTSYNRIYVPRISTQDNIFQAHVGAQEQSGEKLFKKPNRKSKDAYYVWKKSRLPEYASAELIESQLNKWALKYATLECDTDPNIWTITWKNKSGVTFTSKMSTFIKWMQCASMSSN